MWRGGCWLGARSARGVAIARLCCTASVFLLTGMAWHIQSPLKVASTSTMGKQASYACATSPGTSAPCHAELRLCTGHFAPTVLADRQGRLLPGPTGSAVQAPPCRWSGSCRREGNWGECWLRSVVSKRVLVTVLYCPCRRSFVLQHLRKQVANTRRPCSGYALHPRVHKPRQSVDADQGPTGAFTR